MSGLFFEGQDSETVCYDHDRPPQYDAGQPSQDILTCVLENEHTHRKLVQRLYDLEKQAEIFVKNMPKSARPNYLLYSEKCLELELADILKKRTVETTELYTAMSRLTVSEFNRTYASYKRDPNRQIQHELVQDTERAKEVQHETAQDTERAKEIQHKLAHDTKRAKDALAKLLRRFWKRIFKNLARP
ncbi:hypothetical protein N7451_005111 [Penicillium sp. IBT 35674x]|nr:hypothetical protein N7451_005111 [Penicillium sp. IBT 35674x]